MFYCVPIIDGTLDIDYQDLINGKAISDTEALVELKDAAAARPGWIPLTKTAYLELHETGIMTLDKSTIMANGTDKATLEVSVSTLASIDFYDVLNDVAICTQPVAGGKAVLEITSNAPGVVKIRAGQKMANNANVCEVTAFESI